MRRARRSVLMIGAVMAAGLALFGCSESSDSNASSGEHPVRLEKVTGQNGADLHRVTLTATAVRRLGLRAVPVADQAGTKVVPYGAVVYDGHGDTWVYTRTRPNSFVRVPITIQSIVGESVLLSDGPDAGTPVVTVGAAELFGAEHGIGS